MNCKSRRLNRSMLTRLISLVLLAHITGVGGLRSVWLKVPVAVAPGQSATLECNYDLEGEPLYTVKWYKYQDEFYRYTPKENPPTKVFAVNGITENSIQKDKSNGTQLTLRKMTEEMSGLYSCEVSADAPSFQTATVSRTITVVDPPKGKLIMTGLKSKYRLGDVIVANCTAPGSRPAANISWSINNRIAERKHVIQRHRMVEADLEQTISTLKIHARHHHFNDGRLNIKCGASIYQVYWEAAEKTVLLEGKSGDEGQQGRGTKGNNDQQGWTPLWTNEVKHTPLPPTEGFIGEEDILEPAPINNGSTSISLEPYKALLIWLTSALLTSITSNNTGNYQLV
uniref:Cell adhesion molecule 3 n=1 Tax=Lygus hesperus TaxID=30085 RepID=A0A0A9Z9S3_LYGHE